jgi:conjugative relaxase-like TrwC/TraI family protein
VAYVTALYGGSDAQIDYRLGLEHGCGSDTQFSYHADARERPLVWTGEGLEAFGVEGLTAGAELTTDQFEMARNLIRGQHPTTGEQLVAPKVAVPAAAKVSLGPLVAAVREAAEARGISPASLFEGQVALARAWGVAERGVSRQGGRAVARVDQATALAEAAGLDPCAVWGAERVGDARAALVEERPVRDEHGQVVLGADGAPQVEMVAARERVGIAGYDIGITLPKSLSVLLALAPDELVGRIEGIYAEACNRTFAWTEDRTSYVKRGHHGDGQSARRERSGGFSGWVMTHRAARPVGDAAVGDPHWHVHITIANMGQAQDGSWLTVAAGGRELMRHAPAIDALAQAQIRFELRREFGITFARSEETGVWEVEHLPQSARELFSKRHEQVTQVLDALGYSNATASAKEARVLTRASRSGKSEATAAADTTLREFWRAEAVSGGYDPAQWMPMVLARYQAGGDSGTERANETMLARYGITLNDVVARLTHPETGVTVHTRRFSHLDAIRAVAHALPNGIPDAEVGQLTDLVLAHPVFVALPERAALVGGPGAHAQLAGSHEMTGGQLYTTSDVVAAERSIMEAVAASHPDQGRAVVDADTVDMTIAVTEAAQGYALSGEQRDAVKAVVTNGRAIESIEGPPGTGKTTLMRAARVAYEAQGLVVAGAATAANAAQELAAHSGIESRTIAQWLYQVEHGAGLAGVDVLVLDEANLTDDRARDAIYAAAARGDVQKVVEVQDPKQLAAPGCGSMSGYIHAALHGPALTENRRQLYEDERAALTAFREGRHLEALQGWAGAEHVVATHTSAEGIAAMVSTWLRLAEGAPDPHTRADGLLMIARTNEQVTRINQAVQAVRATQEQLGQGRSFALPAGREVTFRVGDQVLIRRNDRHEQAVTGEPLLNGYRGVVTDIAAEGVRVAWRQAGDTDADAPHTTVCGPKYIAEGGLELGYCLTAHKAEGMTVGAQWDRPDGSRNEGSTLIWGPGMDAAGQYVALSRACGASMLFGSLDELEGEREQLLYGQPRDQAELTARVITALAEQAAATASRPDDRPVLVDLGQASAEPTRAQHTEREQQPPPGVRDARGQDHQVTAAETPSVEQGNEHAAAVEVTEAQRQRWEQLADRIGRAWLDGDPDAQRAAEDERRALAQELGPDRAEVLRQAEQARIDTVLRRLQDPEPAPVTVTDAQRQRWDQVLEQATQGCRSGDSDAQRAAEEQQRDYAAELGPARVEVLRQEVWDRIEARQVERDARQVERDTRQRWWERPHSKLTDAALEQTILQAERKRAEQLAAVERARTQLGDTEPAVAEGRGPAVTQLDAGLVELRRMLELRTRADDVELRWQSTRTQASMATAQARSKEMEAARAPWYRPGLRDRRLAQAAELQALAERAHATAADLERQRTELHEQTGEHWHGYTERTRSQVADAEANYGPDLEAARSRDRARLAELRDQISRGTRRADTTGTRRDELTAEHQLRTEMPPGQAATENKLRTQWLLEEQVAAAHRAVEERERAIESACDYHYDPGLHHGHDRSQDHGLGL